MHSWKANTLSSSSADTRGAWKFWLFYQESLGRPSFSLDRPFLLVPVMGSMSDSLGPQSGHPHTEEISPTFITCQDTLDTSTFHFFGSGVHIRLFIMQRWHGAKHVVWGDAAYAPDQLWTEKLQMAFVHLNLQIQMKLRRRFWEKWRSKARLHAYSLNVWTAKKKFFFFHLCAFYRAQTKEPSKRQQHYAASPILFP